MDWEEPSSELVERRKMFGGLTLFLNGHMFAGIHGTKIVVRLSESDRGDAEANVGALPFEPVPGRVMREYVVLPPPVWSDPEALEQWLIRSVEFVGALPPKAPKSRRLRRM
jgi:TfoX/Sxy family transcriptional regulator of competence genes